MVHDNVAGVSGNAGTLDLKDLFDISVIEDKKFHALEEPKLEISKAIKDGLFAKKLSLRKLAKNINNMNIPDYKISYSQIARVTSGENYNITTLLKILDTLDLSLKIQTKSKTNK